LLSLLGLKGFEIRACWLAPKNQNARGRKADKRGVINSYTEGTANLRSPVVGATRCLPHQMTASLLLRAIEQLARKPKNKSYTCISPVRCTDWGNTHSNLELEWKDTWKVSQRERHKGIVVTRWNCCLLAVDYKHPHAHAVLIVWHSK
jgi:hypothetical protein